MDAAATCIAQLWSWACITSVLALKSRAWGASRFLPKAATGGNWGMCLSAWTPPQPLITRFQAHQGVARASAHIERMRK